MTKVTKMTKNNHRVTTCKFGDKKDHTRNTKPQGNKYHKRIWRDKDKGSLTSNIYAKAWQQARSMVNCPDVEAHIEPPETNAWKNYKPTKCARYVKNANKRNK